MYISTSCSLEATHTTGRRLSSERGLLGASETWPRPRALAVFSGGGRLGEGNVELWGTFQATGAGWLAGEKRLGVGLKTDGVGFWWMVLEFFLFVGTRFGWRCHFWCLTKARVNFQGHFLIGSYIKSLKSWKSQAMAVQRLDQRIDSFAKWASGSYIQVFRDVSFLVPGYFCWTCKGLYI